MINIIKSDIAPLSLAKEKAKKSGTYRDADVIERIKTDFHNKCYLCEEKDITSINVEHFIPHRGDKDLEFSWQNLFYCCAHCNNIKGDVVLFDQILNCTDPNHRVLDWIKLKIDPIPFANVEVVAMQQDENTNNTVELLRRAYNGTTPLKVLESANLRKKILEEVKRFNNLLFDYFDETNTESQRESAKDQVRRGLSEKSCFTAFKVWIIRSNRKLQTEFEYFLPTNQ